MHCCGIKKSPFRGQSVKQTNHREGGTQRPLWQWSFGESPRNYLQSIQPLISSSFSARKYSIHHTDGSYQRIIIVELLLVLVHFGGETWRTYQITKSKAFGSEWRFDRNGLGWCSRTATVLDWSIITIIFCLVVVVVIIIRGRNFDSSGSGGLLLQDTGSSRRTTSKTGWHNNNVFWK